MRSLFILVLSIFIFSCVKQQVKKEPDSILFFKKDELFPENHWIDSSMVEYYTESLRAMGERSFEDTSFHGAAFRLTVFPVIYNSYCIRVEETDSGYQSYFTIAPDPKNFKRTGLNGVKLQYSGNSKETDSLFHILNNRIDLLIVTNPSNNLPDSLSMANAVDGNIFLLEYTKNGKHTAIQRWNGYLIDDRYPDSKEFKAVLKAIHGFVPSSLIPDLTHLRSKDQWLFPIFKSENEVHQVMGMKID